MDLQYLKPLVANVLLDEYRAWTVQGFGFLRTYFGPPETPKKYRLNLWDSRFTVPNVSTIHDHPWDFSSVIIAGEFTNQRYVMQDFEPHEATHAFTTIRTGEGGGLEKSLVEPCFLSPEWEEDYAPGMTYSQAANEIHETKFEDGAVTLNERIGDTEHARVFWPYGTDWVDAMPRPASREEVSAAVSKSLQRWF